MTRYLITSALPYINGMKHLGNLIGSLLPADVLARALRAEGEETLFICATDEHGTPAEIAAHEAGQDIAAYCAEQHRLQADVYRRFGLSFDYFGRTSSHQNAELTQHFYRRLDAAGLIEEVEIEQFYSPADGRFLPDRYVIGTCPRCGGAARGDQCEHCAAVLDPTDLIDPRSGISGSAALELRRTKHLYLRLGSLTNRLRDWVLSHPEWPQLTTSVALKWFDEGVRDRCITRDLSWGVPVPRPGFAGKVFYVWFDAPIGYISATKQWADERSGERDWRRWWYGQDDVEYVQFMAKDNLPFHTVFFPATIMGSAEPWQLATYVKGFNWLHYYGGKFSTSHKRGVFMDRALDLYPADYWRYYLLAQAPESDDAEFTWEQFASIVNKDLAGVFGNFVNRTLKLNAAQFGPQIPAGGAPGSREQQLQRDVEVAFGEYRGHLRQTEYRKAIQALRRLWSLGNGYLDDRAPWSLVRIDRGQAAMVLRTAINLAGLFALAASPVIPFGAAQVLAALGIAQEPLRFPAAVDLSALAAGSPVALPPVLYQRVEPEDVDRLRDEFAGVGQTM